MKTKAFAALAALAVTCAFATSALAEEDHVEVVREKPDVRNEAPTLAYAYRAAGVSAKSIGIEAYGLALAAQKQDAVGGGGALVYASPVDRLTLVGDLSRDVTARFAPSAAAIVRLLGRSDRGFSLGIMTKFKVEGFAGTTPTPAPPSGPEPDTEAELEGGILLSYAYERLHLDLNAIGGAGLNEEGEVDVEGRARVGVDLDKHLRVGLDGQFRGRAHGTKTLLGDRAADFASGGQLLAGFGHFFGSLTAGPSTTNVANGVGFAAVIAFGATTL